MPCRAPAKSCGFSALNDRPEREDIDAPRYSAAAHWGDGPVVLNQRASSAGELLAEIVRTQALRCNRKALRASHFRRGIPEREALTRRYSYAALRPDQGCASVHEAALAGVDDLAVVIIDRDERSLRFQWT